MGYHLSAAPFSGLCLPKGSLFSSSFSAQGSCSVHGTCGSRSSLPPHLVPSPHSLHRRHSQPWPRVLPNPNTPHFSSLHPGVLGNPGRFPVPAFCLLLCRSSRRLRAACAAVAAVLASLPGLQQRLWKNHGAKQTPSAPALAPSFLRKIRGPAAFLHALLCLSVCAVSLSTPCPPMRPSQADPTCHTS